ncbi:MAG: DUF817 domain-containing protein [Aquidulcibacter sp.]|jgi:uncharacterized membrane protein YoaT (DUF817 family)|nr:DUF817 domain-containing protein [Aquidulcibacter sp.]MCZ8206754.1 DUF817 domain-containing protein [Aquidulcibacter sp.]
MWASQNASRTAAFEFVMFGVKQAWACLYGGTMLALLILTMVFWPKEGAMLSRFDFLFLAAIALQVLLIALKLERLEEVKVIAIFHVVGTLMELFKTHMGSWTYPGDAFFKIGGVPLFTGFMYACVGSYLARITRLMDLRFSHYPPVWTTWVLAIGAYVNFFTHHFGPDIRVGLYLLSILIFFRCRVYFTPDQKARWMPMLLGFFLVSLFIWFAENIGTFTNTWIYPHQKDGWHLVPLSKMGAWYLLMLLSFVLVTHVHPPQPPDPQAKAPDP